MLPGRKGRNCNEKLIQEYCTALAKWMKLWAMNSRKSELAPVDGIRQQ